jgi:hypothetical protein
MKTPQNEQLLAQIQIEPGKTFTTITARGRFFVSNFRTPLYENKHSQYVCKTVCEQRIPQSS